MNYTYGISAFGSEDALLIIPLGEHYILENHIQGMMDDIKKTLIRLPPLIFIQNEAHSWVQVRHNKKAIFQGFKAVDFKHQSFFVKQ